MKFGTRTSSFVAGRSPRPSPLNFAAIAWVACAFAACDRSGPAPETSSDLPASRPIAPLAQGATHAGMNTCGSAAACPAVPWAPSLEAALDRARRESKPVLIAFSARRQERGSGNEF